MSKVGRRYDPDEIEEEQRERERRNQINRQFNQYVKRVQQDIWERDYGCAAACLPLWMLRHACCCCLCPGCLLVNGMPWQPQLRSYQQLVPTPSHQCCPNYLHPRPRRRAAT